MADISNMYNAANAPEDTGFDPLPAGWYDVEVDKTELRNTKAGNGSYISVQFRVQGPSHAGRVVFGTYNLANPNPKAVEIGHAQFRSLHTACGLPHITDTDQLIGRTCAIKLVVKLDDHYGDKNEVKAARAQTGGSAPAHARNGAPAPAPAGPPRPAGPPPAGLPPRPGGPPKPAGPPAPAQAGKFDDDEIPY
jgi:hypothetical protein